ncbi:MAG: DUF2795 domain-containing protein [Bacteroidaceae bacterium]|nr:DUF2795 domain-containing protein [Bacteroidaceae bacterium]
MVWTLSLIEFIADAPFPCNKNELLDYAERTGAPLTVIENLQELEDDGEDYDGLLDIWPDMPIDDVDFLWEKDEN